MTAEAVAVRTVEDLRAALDGVPGDAELLVCVDADEVVRTDGSDLVVIDPGVVRRVEVRRPTADDGTPVAPDLAWPFADGDPEAPPALAYLLVGEWR